MRVRARLPGRYRPQVPRALLGELVFFGGVLGLVSGVYYLMSLHATCKFYSKEFRLSADIIVKNIASVLL